MSSVEVGCVSILVLVYGVSGVIELPQWRKFIDQFTRWGFPFWWAAFNPVVKITAAGLTLVPQTRVYGVALCVVVAVGAVVTVIYRKELAMYKVALPVAMLTLVASALLLI